MIFFLNVSPHDLKILALLVLQKDPLLCWAKPNCYITQDDLFGLYNPALSFFMLSTIAIICFYRFLNFCGLAASNVALKAA
jgi:hypothetical protein